MVRPIERSPLRAGLRRHRYASSARRTKAPPPPETRPSPSARETTFNGWTPTISSRQTRSTANSTRCAAAPAHARCSPAGGATSSTDRIEPSFVRRRSGAISLRWNGWFASWIRTCSCRCRRGSSVGSSPKPLGRGISASRWTTMGNTFVASCSPALARHFVPHASALYRRSGFGSLSHSGRSNRSMESQCLSMQLHVSHIRSLDDGERVRRACLKYLQRRLIDFYPERLDIVHRFDELAGVLGGRLEIPCLPWKYAWIQRAFGWRVAKHAWRSMARVRSSVTRAWDRTLFELEKRYARLGK